MEGPEKLALNDVPDAEAGPNEVILRPVAGICGSEIEGYRGSQGNRTPPLVIGHEVAGQLVALGDEVAGQPVALGYGVDEAWRGRYVVVNPIVSCLSCRGDRAAGLYRGGGSGTGR